MKKIVIILSVLLLIACGVFLHNEVNKMANEYIYPTGFNDPNGSWNNEYMAFDGDAHTFTSCGVPAASWTNFIEFTTKAIYCSKVKFIAFYGGTNGINRIDLDIYYDGSWHNVYEGSFLNVAWVEKTFTVQYVTKMRMRFYNNPSYVFAAAVYEVMFYETIGKPSVTTNAATGVAGALATLNGNITSTGGEAPTIKGFEHKEGIDGVVSYAYDSGYFAVGAYSKALTGLDPTKKYYFRAYATNPTGGTGYGAWKSFGVDVDAPTVTSSAATLIEAAQATLNGNMTETGGQDATERGFQWKIGATGDVTDLPETGTLGVGAYSLVLEDLSPNVEYYFRAYATNGGGTGYGDWLSFTTDYSNPEVVTHNATDELKNQVTGNGEIVSTGGQDCDERGFDYGLDKVNTSSKSEDAGSYGIGMFDLDITGLTENTEYWYRAWAKYDLFNAVKRTTSAYDKEYPQFQIVGDKIYYVWYERDGSKRQIWTAVSNLDGSGFVATQRTTSAYDKYYPQLQVVGTKIYYVWYESDGTYSQIWTGVMNIDGSGKTATKQTTSAYSKFLPQLQVVGNTIYYVYTEYDGSKTQIWVATSDLNGENFSATKKTTTAYNKYRPQLQVVGTVIYYVYEEHDGSKRQIWVASMDTDGTDWVTTKKTTTAYDKLDIQLQVVDTVIYYVWSEYGGERYQIWVATMDTDGDNWVATQKTITVETYDKYVPKLQVVGTVIYYVWTEYDGDNEQIWIATMDTDGNNWSATKKTTSAYYRSSPQFFVLSPSAIYYVWTEYDDSNEQITTITPFVSYGEWVKFITAASGDVPTGTRKVICSDYSGYTYQTQASETDDGETYTSYFVISTDLTNKQGLAYYRRILDLHLYFKNQISGTATIEVKRDSEPAWQDVGEVTLTGAEEILVKHLACDIRAKHFLFKLSATNRFKYLGQLHEFIVEGDR